MRLSYSMPQPRWNPNVLDANRLFYALWTTALFLLLIWGVYAINETYALNWRRWGNHPREWEHWTGVFTYPFLHGDLEHIWNNTATFFTLNGLLFYFYRSIAARTWILLYLLSGVGLWIFAKGGNHIGASGINYALAAFLFTSGVVRKSQLLLRVTLLVAFLYGGMVWWMLPIDEHISWEGHIAGAVSGLLMAVVFRNKGPLPDLELQAPAPDERLPDWWAAAHPEHPDVIRQRELESNQTTTTEKELSQDVQFRIIPKSSSNKNAPTDGRGELDSKG
jgi:membrane associated rhomboid family serine protease